MIRSHSMKFDGALLQRGFWLYVWEIKGDKSHHVYVGRTGDNSSPHAQSPFKRIGQHLDPSPKAKGNALGKQLTKAGVKHVGCTFEMVAIGPLFPEQRTMAEHVPVRDQMAALERAVADDLKDSGYAVLGAHPRVGKPDSSLVEQLRTVLEDRFPQVRPNKQFQPTNSRLNCGVREQAMQNTADRAKFWADFICNRCQFPSPEKLRQQFEHARLSEFCECGCNSFKVEVSPNAGALPIAQPGHYGMVFEANFRLQNEDKTIEVLLFAGKQGHLEYVEIDCCGNAYPVPEQIQVQEPPFHVHASPAIVL